MLQEESSGSSSGCIEKPKAAFDKYTPCNDPKFVTFLQPIDSFENTIKLLGIEPIKKPYFHNFGEKMFWYNKGALIKFEIQTAFENRPIYYRYYIQDECHWFFKREEYHQLNQDSLLKCDLFYYRDTTVLNAFVGAALYECAFFINADSNHYSMERARKARDKFFLEVCG